MQRRWMAIFALLCICIPALTPVITNASGEDEIYEPGYVRWEGNQFHRIYLSGAESELNLTRDYQGSAMGSTQLQAGQSVSIGPLSMPPLEMGFSGSLRFQHSSQHTFKQVLVSRLLNVEHSSLSQSKHKFRLEITVTLAALQKTYTGPQVMHIICQPKLKLRTSVQCRMMLSLTL